MDEGDFHRDKHPLSMWPVGERFQMNGLRLREADEKECKNWGWSSTEEAIKISVRNSQRAYFILWGSYPLAVWGYGERSPVSQACQAWMFSFPMAEEYPLMFARGSKRFMDYLLGKYTAVEAVVDMEHELARKWLGWLGFQDLMDITSPIGKPFKLIRKER